MHEVGIIDGLKERWLKSANEKTSLDNVFEPISWDEVFLPFGIYTLGLSFSIILVIIENYWFWHRAKKSKKKY